MAPKLKVYGGWVIRPLGAPRGSVQVDGVIATTSQKKAAEAFGTTLGHVQRYWSETGYAPDVAAAMADPGVPYWREMSPSAEVTYHQWPQQ